MKFLGNAYLPREQQAAERVRTADFLRVRGTSKPPALPTDLQTQAGPRGILLTWKLPDKYQDIIGWRVYKDDENTLFQDIRDRGTRQAFIPTDAGASPPVVNLFVSSVNALGIESNKVQSQGKAAVEPGAPTMPTVPPGYNNENSGGGNQSAGPNKK